MAGGQVYEWSSDKKIYTRNPSDPVLYTPVFEFTSLTGAPLAGHALLAWPSDQTLELYHVTKKRSLKVPGPRRQEFSLLRLDEAIWAASRGKLYRYPTRDCAAM